MQNKLYLLYAILLSWDMGAQAQSQESALKDVMGGPLRTRAFAPTARAAVEMPEAVDNSTLPYFPPVIDQRGNSCAQASGIGYLYTYEVNRMLDRNASDSPANRFAYQFSWNMVNGGEDEGGFVQEGLQLAQRYGIMTEADYGTSATYQFRWATGYDKYLRAMQYRAHEILTFDDSIPLMKRWLFDRGDGSLHGGLLAFSGQSTGWHIALDYDGPSLTGYHALLTSLATSGAHAMTIVGYDDLISYTDSDGKTHTGAFIVTNTWGTYSHDNGRYYLPYDFFRNKDVPNSVLSHQVIALNVQTYTPQVVMKVKVNYTSRNDLRFGFGCSDTREAARPLQFRYSYAFYNQGGDYPMQGNGQDSEIELAFDLTNYLPNPTHAYPVYYLNILRSMIGKTKGEGQLVALSLLDYRNGNVTEWPCSDPLPKQLKDGENVFSVRMPKQTRVSTSPISYLDASDNANTGPLEVLDAEGKPYEVTFSNRDTKNQTITIRYQAE